MLKSKAQKEIRHSTEKELEHSLYKSKEMQNHINSKF